MGVTNFTPIVERPVGRKFSLIRLRTTWPPWVIERTSSPSSTMNAPTRTPRASLASVIALTPLVPRLVSRYSLIRVRLAKPPSVIVKTYWTFSSESSAATCAARITDIDSTESPSAYFMPVTPDVARPIGRSWESSARNRTAWPLRETSRISSSG